MPAQNAGPKRTALYDLHVALGAKMVPFAGYEMPVQYRAGILAEHGHTRTAASLFDVSHMGQVVLRGPERAAALEALVPGDIAGLAPGAMRYTLFTNRDAGILDDLMVTNVGDYLFLVVNAACKEADVAHLVANLDRGTTVERLDDRGLLALQGPGAAGALERLVPGVSRMAFMTAAPFTVDGARVAVTRSGYTGEDGFEISIPGADTVRIAERILALPGVAPAGLGARDSLRLEAGLCLYGHDIDPTTTPVEAGLAWTIGKRRRADGGYPGADVVTRELAHGPKRKRVGILPDGKAPAREGTAITDPAGRAIGTVTSGGFGPTVNGPVAMGYAETDRAAPGTPVALVVRGTPRPARIAALPFVPHRYARPAQQRGNA
ncbi:MAG: glycine cleavage system aminomethyltransferase GcvT [Alphaproteobacteria bacterium]|nr:glycine cleavage system aminomethyltransferase GcvT [Alphaproteobacteria bacterium]